MNKKVLIPIRESLGNAHYVIAEKLYNAFTSIGCNVHVVNLDAEENEMVIQGYLDNIGANLLVTIDLVGFELTLLGDDLYYNSLCIPSMNFIRNNPDLHKDALSMRMNFTMEFYAKEEYVSYIKENFFRVPNIKAFDIETANEELLKEFLIKELQEII